MRAIIQRVSEAGVTIEQQLHASIGKGLLVLVGVEESDTKQDAEWLAGKIRQMRIFSDKNGKMNLYIEDVKGEYLVISQFTLHALTASVPAHRPTR